MTKINKDIDNKTSKRTGSLAGSLARGRQANQPDPEFNVKLNRFYVAYGVKKAPDLARFLDITPESIYTARNNLNIPDRWLRIAFNAGISTDWLLSGEGPMRRDERVCESAQSRESPPSLAVNTEVLQIVLKVVEMWLEKENKEMTPDKKSKLVALLYDHSVTTGMVDEGKMISYMKLVA